MTTYSRSDVQTHYDGFHRPALPAVNVKVPLYGAFPDALLREVADDCGHDPDNFVTWWRATEHADDVHNRYPTMVDTYAGFAAESAFEDAQSDAEYLFPDSPSVQVHQEGRSGGWLTVSGLPDLNSWAAPDLGRWRRFATAVRARVADFPRQVAELVAINAYEEHLASEEAAATYRRVGRWEAAFAGSPLAGLATLTDSTPTP